MTVFLIIVGSVIVVIVAIMAKNNQQQQQQQINYSTNEIESPIQNMYNVLSTEQKYSFVNLLSTFQELSRNSLSKHEATQIVNFTCSSLGVSLSQSENYFNSHNLVEGMIKQLRTIKDRAILDSILYDCYCLVMLAHGKEQNNGFLLLDKVFGELGYTEDEMINTIKKIQALSKMFFQK